MNKLYLIIVTVICLLTGSNVQAIDGSSVPSDITHVQSKVERILVLYDNPMEEYTVINTLIAHGYSVKIEKELIAAIDVLKKQAAAVDAHALIIIQPVHKSVESATEKDIEDEKISAKAIRYKHFYY